MTDRELFKMALDTLSMAVEPKKGKVYAFEFQPIDCAAMYLKAIETLRARLAQPEPVIQARKEGDLIVVDLPQVPTGGGGITKDEQPEPVAVLRRVILGRGQIFWLRSSDELPNETLLYTAPPQREWVGLTDKEIEDCLEMSIQGTCRAIEAKLKEKNGY
jgi:hypothetical protein